MIALVTSDIVFFMLCKIVTFQFVLNKWCVLNLTLVYCDLFPCKKIVNFNILSQCCPISLQSVGNSRLFCCIVGIC
jgi:hypothetical protein